MTDSPDPTIYDDLYAKIGFPAAAHLGKRVFKTLFHENALLTATDKAALTDDIDVITWKYTLKPGTVPIQPYVDDQREYLEVAIIHVDLKTQNRTDRLNQIIQRAIPYPVLTLFAFESNVALGVAHKRFGQARKSEIVAEDMRLTDWINLETPASAQSAFLASLRMRDLPQTHFLAFYGGLMNRVLALECAQFSGVYQITSTTENADLRRERLATCHDLEALIAERRGSAKKESQVNRLVALNLEIKELEARLQTLSTQL